MKTLFDTVSAECSRLVTVRYSTSFSLGIRFLARKFHIPVYSIYGFVRLADEIVDSFHGYDKPALLHEFREETYKALERGISVNPVLNGFVRVARRYNIGAGLIDPFLDSMGMDLENKNHDRQSYNRYILGSAEAVGLMCLKVFCEGDEPLYASLKPHAMQLGAAFQKVNFLRDLKSDNEQLGRVYFPGVSIHSFHDATKQRIEEEIQRDFSGALAGIRKLPPSSRAGVYLAYYYYCALFRKIKSVPAGNLMRGRIRVSNPRKIGLMVHSMIKYRFNLM